MFYWGNYIPSTIVQVTDLAGSPVFNIDELVETIENARKRYDVDQDDPDIDWNNFTNEDNIILNSDSTIYGVYDASGNLMNNHVIVKPGALRWEEKKSSETAVKQNKTIDYSSTLGYLFYVVPSDFGNVTIREPDGTNITSTFNINKIIIDGVEYNVCTRKSVFSVNSTIQLKFELN